MNERNREITKRESEQFDSILWEKIWRTALTVFRKCVWTILSYLVMPLTYDARSILCCLLVSQRGKGLHFLLFWAPCTILCPAGHVSVLPVRHPCHCPAALPSWETARLTVGVTHQPQMGSLKISSNSERTVCIRSASLVLPPLIGTITDLETNARKSLCLIQIYFSNTDRSELEWRRQF